MHHVNAKCHTPSGSWSFVYAIFLIFLFKVMYWLVVYSFHFIVLSHPTVSKSMLRFCNVFQKHPHLATFPSPFLLNVLPTNIFCFQIWKSNSSKHLVFHNQWSIKNDTWRQYSCNKNNSALCLLCLRPECQVCILHSYNVSQNPLHIHMIFMRMSFNAFPGMTIASSLQIHGCNRIELGYGSNAESHLQINLLLSLIMIFLAFLNKTQP